MRLFILILSFMIFFSCNNSGGTGFTDEYLDELDDGNGFGEVYTLSGSIQYENADCTGSETYMSGMCLPEDEDDPNAFVCIFMNLAGDSQLVEEGCNEESACTYASFFDMMPLTLTFFDDGSLDYSIGEFCSNIMLTSENECIEQGNSWTPAVSVEGTCVEDNDTITCNSIMADEPLVFVRIDSNTLVGQDIDVDDYGVASCTGMVLTKQ